MAQTKVGHTRAQQKRREEIEGLQVQQSNLLSMLLEEVKPQ